MKKKLIFMLAFLLSHGLHSNDCGDNFVFTKIQLRKEIELNPCKFIDASLQMCCKSLSACVFVLCFM